MKPIKTFPISDIFCTAWHQLTPDAMHMLISARQLLKGKKLKVATAQAVCKKPFIYLQLSAEKLHDIIADLTFLNSPCTVFSLTSLKHKGETYYAPGTALSNLRMLELIKADSYLDLFQRTGKEEFLNKLIAVLYRPAAQEPAAYDVREKFDSSTVEARAEALSTIRNEHKQVILFNYVECWKVVLKQNAALFPQQKESSGNSSGQSRVQMWMDVLFDLGETTYFAGEQAAKQAFIHEALPYLNKKAKERQPK